MLKYLKKFWLPLALFTVSAGLTFSLWEITWAELAHILERSIIHIFCAAAVLKMFQGGLSFAERKLKLPALRGWWFFIVPGVFAVFIIFLREPYDVVGGNPLVKSYLDPVSWFLGMTLSAWGDWRLHERMAVCWSEVKERQVRRGIS